MIWINVASARRVECTGSLRLARFAQYCLRFVLVVPRIGAIRRKLREVQCLNNVLSQHLNFCCPSRTRTRQVNCKLPVDPAWLTAHDDDAVGKHDRFLDVMRYEKYRELPGLPK